MEVYTKEAYEVGCDARCQQGYRRKVKLRETKTMLISECGRRYMKRRGLRTPGDWPMFMLDKSTIKDIN